MTRIHLICWLLIANLTPMVAADAMDRMKRLAAELTGTYDQPQLDRWATVYFVARQEGNRFPGIWPGRWTAGDLRLRAEYDLLDDVLRLGSTGGIELTVADPTNRIGLEELIPMQALVSRIRQAPISFRIHDFQDWQMLAEDAPQPWGRRPPAGHRLRCTGTVVVRAGDQSWSFPGQTLFFTVDAADFSLRLRAELTLIGKDMGLPLSQHGPLTLWVDVKGPPPSVDLPGARVPSGN